MTDSDTALCLYDRLLRLIASMDFEGTPEVERQLINRLQFESGLEPSQLAVLIPFVKTIMDN